MDNEPQEPIEERPSYRLLRMSRFTDLRRAGFLGWEADVLSQIPRRVPYLSVMAVERARYVDKWLRQGHTRAEIGRHITKRYIAKGYTKGRGVGSEASVWAMLRDYEEPYKRAHPDYQPKYRHKRERNTSRTISKINKTMNKTQIKNEIARLQRDMDSTSDQKRWRRNYNEQQELKRRLERGE